VTQGTEIRLGKLGKALHRQDGKAVDDDDVVEGIVLLRKGADAEKVLADLHEKVDFVNRYVLPPGVKIVPYLDRSNLVSFTTHTVLHNLGEGIALVVIVLFLFLGNIRSAFIVALTIPFSLLFASILLDLRHIPANLLSLGALDFGMVVDGSVVMVENILRHLSQRRDGGKSLEKTIREAAHEVQLPVFYAIAIIITAYLPIFTLQHVEGRLFHPMAWTVAFALLGAILFAILLAPVLAQLLFPRGNARMAQSRFGIRHRGLPKVRRVDPSPPSDYTGGGRCRGAVDVWVGGERPDRLRVSPAPRRRRHLGARYVGPQHRAQ